MIKYFDKTREAVESTVNGVAAMNYACMVVAICALFLGILAVWK